ncbi:MAG: hypothetical protein ACLRWQ_20080 [Flavonifractor plautii]
MSADSTPLAGPSFCYKHLPLVRQAYPTPMLVIVVGNVLVWLMDQFSYGVSLSALLAFSPYYILHGQIWRIITFVFVPLDSNLFFLAVSLYFYYMIGSVLEREWGTAKFNVFYGLGILLNVVVGFLLYAVTAPLYPSHLLPLLTTASMTYVNLSLFFAFATLYPNMQVLLFFIIPIKIKWLAWIDAALFGWSVLSSLFGVFTSGLAALPGVIIPLVAILNYFIFFWDNFLQLFGRVKYQTSRQTVNFKKATKQAQQQKGYIHKCAVCGKTDTDYPNEEFRYCSKCNGYYCYCSEHIHSHVHIPGQKQRGGLAFRPSGRSVLC